MKTSAAVSIEIFLRDRCQVPPTAFVTRGVLPGGVELRQLRHQVNPCTPGYFRRARDPSPPRLPMTPFAGPVDRESAGGRETCRGWKSIDGEDDRGVLLRGDEPVNYVIR
jgi:hypothetical protein